MGENSQIFGNEHTFLHFLGLGMSFHLLLIDTTPGLCYNKTNSAYAIYTVKLYHDSRNMSITVG